jgi:hypothetical protein
MVDLVCSGRSKANTQKIAMSFMMFLAPNFKEEQKIILSVPDIESTNYSCRDFMQTLLGETVYRVTL